MTDYPIDIGTHAMYRGDAEGRNKVRIAVDDGATPPVPVDLTGYGPVWSSQARTSPSGAAVDLDVDDSGAATGVLVVSIPLAASATLPRTLRFDVEATGGAVDPITVFAGRFTATGEYTKGA